MKAPSKKKALLTLAGAFGLFASIGATRTYAAGCGDGRACGDVHVTKLFIDDDMQALKVLTDGDETQLSCTLYNGKWLTMPTSAPTFRETYAMLLSAFLSDSKTTVRLNTDSSTCTIWYVTVQK